MLLRHDAGLVLVTFVIWCTAPLAYQEKQLKKSDLPAEVQKTADEQSKGGYGKEL